MEAGAVPGIQEREAALPRCSRAREDGRRGACACGSETVRASAQRPAFAARAGRGAALEDVLLQADRGVPQRDPAVRGEKEETPRRTRRAGWARRGAAAERARDKHARASDGSALADAIALYERCSGGRARPRRGPRARAAAAAVAAAARARPPPPPPRPDGSSARRARRGRGRRVAAAAAAPASGRCALSRCRASSSRRPRALRELHSDAGEGPAAGR